MFVPLKSFGLSTWWPLLTWKVKRSDIKCYTLCPYISRVTLAKGSKQEGKVFLEQETPFASRISKRAVLGIGFTKNREIYHLAKKWQELLPSVPYQALTKIWLDKTFVFSKSSQLGWKLVHIVNWSLWSPICSRIGREIFFGWRQLQTELNICFVSVKYVGQSNEAFCRNPWWCT